MSSCRHQTAKYNKSNIPALLSASSIQALPIALSGHDDITMVALRVDFR